MYWKVDIFSGTNKQHETIFILILNHRIIYPSYVAAATILDGGCLNSPASSVAAVSMAYY